MAPAFSNLLDAALRKLGAVGRASGCEAQVIDANLAPVPEGQTGEIAIRSPNVMLQERRGHTRHLRARRLAAHR